MEKLFFSKKERAEMKADYDRDFGIYYRRKMEAEGICIRCHKRRAMADIKYCRPCAEYRSAYNKKWRAKRRLETAACI